MYKLKLNADTAWVPQYVDLEEYLLENGDGVRVSPTCPKSDPTSTMDACASLLGDSGFTMFHNHIVSTAALHGYLQKSTAHDLMRAICKSVTVIEPTDSEDEEGQSKQP